MGYFSSLLQQSAAQAAVTSAAPGPRKGRYASIADTPAGQDIFNPLFAQMGFTGAGDGYDWQNERWGGAGATMPNWSATAGASGAEISGMHDLGSLPIGRWVSSGSSTGESGGEGMWVSAPVKNAFAGLSGYTFDWDKTGYGGTGTLTAYDPDGKEFGRFSQSDQSTLQSLSEAALLAAAGFGGVGLLGLGPLGGLLGGAGGVGGGLAGVGGDVTANLAAYGASLTPAEIAATAGIDLGVSGVAGSGITGGGLAAGGSAGYGSIAAPSSALGAGGAGLSSGAGLTAPAFVGSGAGITGGLGMTAGATAAASSAGGLSGLLGTVGSYLPAAQSLASIASGIYGMKLAGDAREASDPFAPYRAGYGQKLAALEANPGSIVTRPGFQAGLETIGRKSAASGYYGSGNMASALSRYSGDFYTQEASRLAGLAGANQTPGAGQFPAADLAGQSLGSIGYGLGPLLQRLVQGG